MNETIKTARDLTEIRQLALALPGQAVSEARSRVMPGGLAMVCLGPIANPEAWEHQYEGWEAHNHRVLTHEIPGRVRDLSHVSEEDDTWEPVLQVLTYWSNQWRAIHGAEYDNQPTIDSEANFLRWSLDWAAANEPRFDKFAKDVNRARRHLEDVVHDGDRAERTRVLCDSPVCEDPARLIRTYSPRQHVANECTACGNLTDPGPAHDCEACDLGTTREVWQSDPADDGYKCPACRSRYTQDDFDRTYKRQLRSEGAERWVPLVDARGTLAALGRPERTVRKWLEEGEVQSCCELGNHRVLVWWPDMWRLHLTTPQRRRRSA